MKKTLYCIFISLALIACKQSVTEKEIAKITGYWEINKVKLPDGSYKDYKVNETIDYFGVKNNKGFRQKVMPQFNGSYKTNGIKETFTISNVKGVFYIHYVTPYGKWQEEIIEVQDSSLVLRNKEQLEYHYKRHRPFSIK